MYQKLTAIFDRKDTELFFLLQQGFSHCRAWPSPGSHGYSRGGRMILERCLKYKCINSQFCSDSKIEYWCFGETQLQPCKHFANVRVFLTTQDHYTGSRCHRTAWRAPATVCRTAIDVAVQEHSISYCRCREAVKLFIFLPSLYSLIGISKNMLNCNFRWPPEMKMSYKFT
jgi:hypothetical protein